MDVVFIGLLVIAVAGGIASGGVAGALVYSRSRAFEEWAADGLIATEQIAALRERDQADALRERRHRIARGLAIVGGLTVAAGVVLFFAANWGEIPRVLRLLVLVTGVVAFHLLGWWLRELRGTSPAVGHAFLILGSILFGASLFLVGQMYNVDTHSPLGWLLWAAGSALVAALARSTPLATLTTLVFGAWIVHELVTLGGSGYEAYELIPAALAFYGLALYGIGTRTRVWLAPIGFSRAPRAIGFAIAAISMLVFTFRDASFLDEPPHGGVRTLLIGLAIAALAGALALTLRAARRTGPLEGIAVAAATGLVLVTIFSREAHGEDFSSRSDSGHPLFFVALLVVLTLGAVIVAYVNDELWLAQAAFAFAALELVARFVDPGWSMLPRSLVFIAVGTATLTLGAVLERRRGQPLSGVRP